MQPKANSARRVQCASDQRRRSDPSDATAAGVRKLAAHKPLFLEAQGQWASSWASSGQTRPQAVDG
jgi:hypothetical protein